MIARPLDPTAASRRPLRLIAILVALGVAQSPALRAQGADGVVSSQRGLVVSVSAPASDVGAAILARGIHRDI